MPYDLKLTKKKQIKNLVKQPVQNRKYSHKHKYVCLIFEIKSFFFSIGQFFKIMFEALSDLYA